VLPPPASVKSGLTPEQIEADNKKYLEELDNTLLQITAKGDVLDLSEASRIAHETASDAVRDKKKTFAG